MSNSAENKLYIPDAMARPGDKPDFSHIDIPAAGSVARPAVDVKPEEIRDLAYDLIRVLGDDHKAVGDWNPNLDPDLLRAGLRYMTQVRIMDNRMHTAQRQGKMSFYMKCTGEEAIAVAAAQALREDDMCFPTYRQHAWLLARDYPMKDMMCQVLSNAGDPLEGKQLPIMYSVKSHGYFSISGNLGTQYIQASGWAMANAYKGNDSVATAFIGDGSTAESDFHTGLLFASVYRAPVILNIVNNQWAISSFQSIAGGENTTLAARGIGYGLPSLRVDGNDFLAVYAATQWAAERARAGLGATVIEFFTYRVAPHSTSDDPSGYRPKDEHEHWPLGDPLERLKQHLIELGEWSEEQQEALEKELDDEVQATWKESLALGTIHDAGGSGVRIEAMFEQVYEEMPQHIKKQRQQLGV